MMDRDIFIITSSDELNVGTVGEILSEVDDPQRRSSDFAIAIRDIIDELAFSSDGAEQTNITIEIR